MSYAKRTWVNGEVITAEKLNHMEDGIEGAGGGGYDLVITVDCGSYDYYNEVGEIPIANYTIASGSIESCEEKIANGQPVNVFLGYYQKYGDVNAPNILYCEMYISCFSVAYRIMEFSGGVLKVKYSSNYELDELIWD